MTDFEREEEAFRSAFQRRAGEAPVEVPVPGRRRRVLPQLLVAAVVLAVIGGAYAVLRENDPGPTPVPPTVSQSYWENRDWRWIGVRDVEVKAPADWAPEYEVGRPDCIRLGTDDVVTPGMVPVSLTDPYVVIGNPGFATTSQGCFQINGPDDPPPAFGELPFPLWQPYVKIQASWRGPAKARPENQDAELEFRGWRLTRTTTAGVQVTVLSEPGDEELAAEVLRSLRRVEVNDVGCPARSTMLANGIRVDLDAAPLPAPDEVAAVAICDYVSDGDQGWLRGSRRMTHEAAQDLVRDIRDAPRGSGPDSPGSCLTRPGAERALALAVFTDATRGARPVSSAYLFFDSCVGSGILEPSGTHEITRAVCAPLFAEPPIPYTGGHQPLADRCHSRDPRLPGG